MWWDKNSCANETKLPNPFYGNELSECDFNVKLTFTKNTEFL